jgi:carboxypeptidase Taq
MGQLTAYQILHDRFHHKGIMGDISAILMWDSATTLKSTGARGRGDQQGTLSLMRHRLISDPDMPNLLAAAAADNTLSGWEKANVREMTRVYQESTIVDPLLTKSIIEQGQICEMAWRQARADNDFASLVPQWEKMFSLVREKAAMRAQHHKCRPYEGLRSEDDSGLTVDEFTRLFQDLDQFVTDFIPLATDAQASQGAPLPCNHQDFSVEKQQALGVRIIQDLGFDWSQGRLDETTHPFCIPSMNDIRLTTRYKTTDYSTGLMAILHECGHGLYEQNLPTDWRYQPIGQAVGMGVHESQALFTEMQVCRSRAFYEYVAPLICEAFGVSGPSYSAENLHRHSLRVNPGFIRVDADEVTYPAHVLLRYKIEKALIDDALPVKDIPGLWNQYMDTYLGLTPPTDTMGCLQDIHWNEGFVGYFPNYTIGAMIAAQLFEAMTHETGDVSNCIARGDFKAVSQWTKNNIHKHGSYYGPQELIAKATGKRLSIDAYKKHLTKRYLNDH